MRGDGANGGRRRRGGYGYFRNGANNQNRRRDYDDRQGPVDSHNRMKWSPGGHQNGFGSYDRPQQQQRRRGGGIVFGDESEGQPLNTNYRPPLIISGDAEDEEANRLRRRLMMEQRRKQQQQQQQQRIPIKVLRATESPAEIAADRVETAEAVEKEVEVVVNKFEEFLEKRKQRHQSYLTTRGLLLDARLHPPAPPTGAQVKRTAVLIRKIKNITNSSESPQKILDDLQKYNLTRYISEVSTAICESKFGLWPRNSQFFLPKTNDLNVSNGKKSVITRGRLLGSVQEIGLLSEIVTLMATRYSGFIPDFAPRLLALCSPAPDDGSNGGDNLKATWKLFGELILRGLFDDDSIERFRRALSTTLMSDERGTYLAHAILFVRHFGDDFCDFIPSEITIGCRPTDEPIKSAQLLSQSIRERFVLSFENYYDSVNSLSRRAYKNYLNIVAVNKKTLETRGLLKPERQQFTDNSRKTLKRIVDQINRLADLMGKEEKLELGDGVDGRDADIAYALGGTEIPDVVRKCPYEDEESRKFYEDLPRPSQNPDDLFQDDDEDEDLGDCVGGVGGEDKMPTNHGLQAVLEKLTTADLVDSWTSEFLANPTHNNRQGRKRLLNTIYEITRRRSDLMTFHARLIAIFSSSFPILAARICERIANNIRFQLRVETTRNEVRLRLCRLMGELVKFRVCPTDTVIGCLRNLLSNFTGHRIEMSCALLESCGLFLYRTPQTHNQTRVMIDILKRKRQKLSLNDSAHKSTIDAALHHCLNEQNSSDEDYCYAIDSIISTLPQNQRLACYILTYELGSDEHQIAEALSSLIQQDHSVLPIVCQYLSKVENVSTAHLPVFGRIISLMEPRNVRSIIVDYLLERVRVGLLRVRDTNRYQRLINLAHYVSNLFILAVIDKQTFLNVYYAVLIFNWANPETDPSDGILRIRMACAMLEIGGSVFRHENSIDSHRHLDMSILYLQKFFWWVRSLPCWVDYANQKSMTNSGRCHHVSRLLGAHNELSFPIEVIAQYMDTVANLWYGFVFACNLEQACRIFERSFLKDLGDVRAAMEAGCEEVAAVAEPAAAAAAPQPPPPPPPTPEPENFEEDFDAVYNSLMTEHFKERTVEIQSKRHEFTASTPVPKAEDTPGCNVTRKIDGGDDGRVEFVVLCRRKNQPKTRTIRMPDNLNVVKRIRQNQRTRDLQTQTLKQRTLHLSMMQEMEEYGEDQDDQTNDLPVIERTDVILHQPNNNHQQPDRLNRRSAKSYRKQRK